MRSVDTPQASDASRLRSMLGRLIEVSELNTDEIEETTRQLVAEALGLPEETDVSQGK